MKYVFILVLLIIGGAGAVLGGVVAFRWVNNMTQTPRIMPGEDLKCDRRVLHATRQRAEMVQRPGQWKHAAARNAAIGGLDANRTAPGRRTTDRAAGVGTHRHAHHARRNRGTGPR